MQKLRNFLDINLRRLYNNLGVRPVKIHISESEKFRRAGVVPLNLGDSVKMVITDSNIPDSARKSLESKSIEVVTAELD